MIEQLRRLFVGLALAGMASCGPVGPAPKPPAPPSPDPLPVCQPGATCGCWHKPPGEEWQKLPDCSPGPVAGCTLIGEETIQSSQTNTLGKRLNEAMHKLVPQCEIGADCLINGYTQATWFTAVAEELRKTGLCAGPGGDEMQIAEKATDPWQNFHVFVGDDSSLVPAPPGARRTVNWSPQAFRGSWVSPMPGLPPAPPPGPPVPPPTPPPPSWLACGWPVPPKVWTASTLPDGWGQDQIGKPRWMISCGRHGKIIDCVAKIDPRACDYCASIGMGTMPDGVQPRCGCPVRQEGHVERVPCETYLTGGTKLQTCAEARSLDPKVTCQPLPNAQCAFAHGNPFQFEQSDGQCRLCSKDGSVCSEEWF